MQSTTWTGFLDRLTHTVGDGVVGVIHEETSAVSEEAERRDSLFSPTFVRRGRGGDVDGGTVYPNGSVANVLVGSP